ncbi:MAG: UDP-glucose 4-epimerase GalE [Bacteroidia bacterium]
MTIKVLVTGGTGFIGSHTAVELLNNGYEVVIADNLSNSHENVLAGIAAITHKNPFFSKTDLQNKEELALLFAEHPDIKAVIHFAALKAVGESVENPLLYYRNNLVSLLNLLELMADNQIQHIVFSSSCTVYGEPDSLPVSENAPVKKAESPYGNTKKMAEDILADTCRASALNCVSLRYFNPTGAHPSALIGELPIGTPNNLMPLITQTAIGKRNKITVYGDDYPTPDGTCIRDYIHVADLANAHVVALERMLNARQKSNYEIFNLGTGKGYSVLETIKTFEKVTGQKLNYEIGTRRKGDVIAVYADTEFANKELGWKAELDLADMVSTAWNWEKHLALTEKEEK